MEAKITPKSVPENAPEITPEITPENAFFMDQNELTKFVHLMVLLKKMTYFTTLDDRLRNELQLLINVNVNNNLQKKQLTNFKKKH